MKKIIAMLAAAALLVGCKNPVSGGAMNSAERSMITVLANNSDRCDEGYNIMVEGINGRGKSDLPAPQSFCELSPAIRLSSKIIEGCNTSLQKITPAEALYTMYGKTLNQLCGEEDFVAEEPELNEVRVDKPSVQIDNGLQTTRGLVLSVSKMEQLRAAVADCPRAANKFMDMVDGTQMLTLDHAEEVNTIIAQCQRKQVEDALNQ